MNTVLYILGALWVAQAAPPVPPRLYQPAPAHIQQQLNNLDYYLDSPEVANYYHQAQHKQGNAGPSDNGAPSRLETMEPDSEVELVPGAQQPQQPPQQNPVNPNIPGLIPGQRVYIVHMPVAGYRPGSIGGYQPVYIVAAAPQGNTGYNNPNGYQNAILLDPSGQGVISPFIGYPRQGIHGVGQGIPGVGQGYPGVGQGNPGLIYGGAPLVNRPFDLLYQDPNIAYQQGAIPQGLDNRGVRLNQLVALQPGAAGQPANAPANAGIEGATSNTNSKRVGEVSDSIESKEATEEPRRNTRPTPAHAQTLRNKA